MAKQEKLWIDFFDRINPKDEIEGVYMGYEKVVQASVNEIDRRITEHIRTEELAGNAGYSVFHFCRFFVHLTGLPVQTYITRRKLAYALYALQEGGKVIDVAIQYGFETHAGFTKAFKRQFGFPPSLYRLYADAPPPGHMTIEKIKKSYGGRKMQVQMRQIRPFPVVGYPSRHMMPGVSGISDILVFWDRVHMDYGPGLSTLHYIYKRSHHCEVGVCFDVDDEHDGFTYMLGVGVDEADADIPQRPGTYLHRIAGGLYAVFTTPLVEEDLYPQSIRQTWQEILTHWLPESAYVCDDTRAAFEYYDTRDHAWLHDGKSQMDIYIPVCKRA